MAATSKNRVNSGLEPYSERWDKAAVQHLLRRVHFGITKEDVAYYLTKTASQAIDDILNIDYTPAAPPVNNYNDRNPDPRVSAGESWVNDYNGLFNNQRRQSFKAWWSGQIINHDRSIREQMVLFWHNHFSTQSNIYNWANFAYQNNTLIRSSCLKNFKTLVKDMTLDPAMLIYLNGERNTKEAPDENYSRELQELFTLGKGPASQFTEHDVREGARVLTGWRINKQNGTVYFQQNRHDTDDKQFSSFYKNTTIPGQTGAMGGEQELDDMLTMIFDHNEVSKYLVRKLYQWFVYYEIDDNTEATIIEPLATIFRDSAYEVKPVLDALLKSAHFFDTANRGAMIKSPVVFSHGLVRMFDLPMPNATDYVSLYNHWSRITSISAIQQQSLGDPPSVAGWPAYYQVPMYYELWINSDTLQNRNKMTDILTTNGYNINGVNLQINYVAFASKFNSVTDPEQFINELIDFFYTLTVDQKQKAYMKSILLSGQLADSYWTAAWNDFIADQNSVQKKQLVAKRLAFLYKYIMNLSEFQLA